MRSGDDPASTSDRRERDSRANFSTTLVTSVVLFSVNALTGILASRLLGADGRGQLAAIQLWPAFLATVGVLGLPEALIFFTARRPKDAGSLLMSALVLCAPASALLVIAGYVAIPHLLADQGPKVIDASQVYLLLVPLYALVGLSFHPLRALGRHGIWNMMRLMPSAVWLGILCIAYAASLRDPAILAMLYLVGLGLLTLPVMYAVRTLIAPPYRPRRRDWVPLLRFGIPASASNLPQLLNVRVDQLLLAGFVSARSLGLYVGAVAWSAAVAPVLTSLGLSLLPHVARSVDDSAAAIRALTTACRLGVLFAAVTALPLILLTPIALPLVLGGEFRDAVVPAIILVFANAILGVAYILEEGLKGLGDPKQALIAEAVGLVPTGGLLLVLLPRFGITGAAIASCGGYAAVMSTLLVHCRRRYSVKSRTLLLPTAAEVRLVTHTVRTAMGSLLTRRSG